MHSFIRLGRLLAAATLVAAAAATHAEATRPEAWRSQEIAVTVSGTSTLHPWTVESRSATGEIRRHANGTVSGWLHVPATSLSGGPRGLNDKMYAALKTKTHATITFEAAEIPLPAEFGAKAADVTWNVPGKLTIVGNARPLTVPCRASQTENGGIRLEAEVPLKMTDFGVAPPTFMGLVRTGDEIKVRVVWSLAAAGPTATAALARR